MLEAITLHTEIARWAGKYYGIGRTSALGMNEEARRPPHPALCQALAPNRVRL